jgi:drug/metabolite transporter (DMT)-like permease
MARHSFAIPPTASLILASAFWGVATVISKELLTTVPPITFLIIQLVPSVSALWIIVFVNGMPVAQWRTMLPLALIGWLNPGLSYTFSMLGLTRTTASVTALLWAAEPVLIAGMAWLILREALTGRFLAVTATAVCGVLLVSGVVANDDPLAADGYGTALILAGVLCCALYTVLSRRMASAAEPLPTVAVQQTVGLIWVAAISPLELGSGAIEHVLTLSLRDFLGGAMSGLMYYAAAFYFYLKGLRCVRANVAGASLNLVPLFAIATAYVFLGERLTQSQWVGAAAILLSVVALLFRGAPSRADVFMSNQREEVTSAKFQRSGAWALLPRRGGGRTKRHIE